MSKQALPTPEIQPPSADFSTSDERRRSRKLFSLGLAAMAVGVGYYAYSATVVDPLHLYLGLLMIVLSVLPGLLWARQAKFGLPLFETFMLTGLNTYAIPLLSGHQALRNFAPETITLASVGVVLFQIAANVSFVMIRSRPKRTAFWRDEIMTKGVSRFLGYGMIATTAYTIIINFTDWIPSDLAGILRAVAYGVGIIATFIQARRWGAGDLPHHEKISFTFLVVLQVIFSWATLYLVGGLSILILGLLGYVSGGKKIPVLLLMVVLPVVALLHNGKSAMRQKYWEEGHASPTITELPGFFTEWVNNGLDFEAQSKRNESNRLLERTSLFHLMCLVASITPDHQPYLNGETYAQIPGQFVPAFFGQKNRPGTSAPTRSQSTTGCSGQRTPRRPRSGSAFSPKPSPISDSLASDSLAFFSAPVSSSSAAGPRKAPFSLTEACSWSC